MDEGDNRLKHWLEDIYRDHRRGLFGLALSIVREPATAEDTGMACNEVSFEGVCSGDLLTWCSDQGTLMVQDCAANGTQCGYDVTSDYNDCINPELELATINAGLGVGDAATDSAFGDAGCSGGAGSLGGLAMLLWMLGLVGWATFRRTWRACEATQ